MKVVTLALFKGDPAGSIKWQKGVVERLRTFLATYGESLMLPLTEFAWGLGIVAHMDIAHKKTEASGRWTAEHEADALKAVDDFVDYVTKVLKQPGVFDTPAIKAKVERLQAFMETGLLDGVQHQKRYSIIDSDGDPAFSGFMDKMHQELSNLVKDTIVALDLMTRAELDSFVPPGMVAARYGFGQDVPEHQRNQGRAILANALLAAIRGTKMVEINDVYTWLSWEFFVASFYPSDVNRPLILDPAVDIKVFLDTFLSQTTDPSDPAQGKYYQKWKIVKDADGVQHWRRVKGIDGKTRIYFEIQAKLTEERRVCYLELDGIRYARPLADGFGAFVNPADRKPSARWDDGAELSTGDYAGKPTAIGAGGAVNDLAGPGCTILQVQVEPSSWQCLTVLLNGWGPSEPPV